MDVEARGAGDDGSTHSLPVDDAVLRRVVESSLGRPVSAVADVRAEQLAGLGFTGSIHRLNGVARSGADDIPWCIVRKHVADTGGNESDVRYWRREPLAYSSGLINDLVGVSAPRCHEVVDQKGGTELWLDDVPSDSGPWGLAHTAVAASDVGQFNASYLAARALPNHSWLSQRWLAQWVEQASPAFDELDAAIDDPWVARLYPRPVIEQARALWTARHEIHRRLAALPPVLAHLDVTQRNTFVGDGRTTLIDWAFVGLATLGEDLAPLVGGSTLFGDIDPDDLTDLDEAGFDCYLEGARAGGWNGDARSVRFAYCAASALRFCVAPMAFYICGLGPDGSIAHNGGLRNAEQRASFAAMFHTPIEDFVDIGAATNHFLTVMGAEALALLDDL